MIVVSYKEWGAATILTTLKNANLVQLVDLNKYGRIISSGHGFYNVKLVDSDQIIKCRRNKLNFL